VTGHIDVALEAETRPGQEGRAMCQPRAARRGLLGAAELLVLAVALAAAAPAPPADQASPKVVKLRFENDRVRVLETISHPGDREQMHSHPANVVLVLTGGKLRITGADGKTSDVELKTGDTVWRTPVTHAAENVGSTQLHAIIVELRQ
jgi:beta-alanine degradation protein BauB